MEEISTNYKVHIRESLLGKAPSPFVSSHEANIHEEEI